MVPLGERIDDSFPVFVVFKTKCAEHHNMHLGWNPSGTLLAASCNKRCFIVDAESGRVDYSLQQKGYVGTVAWNPSGTKLAAASRMGFDDDPDELLPPGEIGGDCYLVDVASHEVLHLMEREDQNVVNFEMFVYNTPILAWSPCGNWLAAAVTHESDADMLLIADAATGEIDSFFVEFENIDDLAWNPSGTKLAIGCDKTHSAPKRKKLSWDGEDWVRANWDGSSNELGIVDVVRGELERMEFEGGCGAVSVAWDPTGTKVVMGGFDGVGVVSPEQEWNVDGPDGDGPHGVRYTERVAWTA